jgi:hypothetical protein
MKKYFNEVALIAFLIFTASCSTMDKTMVTDYNALASKATINVLKNYDAVSEDQLTKITQINYKYARSLAQLTDIPSVSPVVIEKTKKQWVEEINLILARD